MMRKRFSSWLLLALGGLGLFLGGGPTLAAVVLNLQVGEMRVLAHPGVARVAVGSGECVHAVPVDRKEVIIFARAEGESSLHVWTHEKRSAYVVRVAPAQSRRRRAEIEALLAHIPGARWKVIGNQIVVEGQGLSDANRARVVALAERYPQVLDFTSKVGWDRMVLFDVQVVELPRARLLELGVRWDTTSQGGITAGWVAGTRMPGPLTQPIESMPSGGALSAVASSGYAGLNVFLSSRLNVLTQNGEAVMLAQPQLLARSGSTAEFLAGGEVPYAIVDKAGNASTIFKPYGVSLRITPTIATSGVIRSRIEVEASSVDATLTAQGGPALKTRRAATEFNVQSGHTLVIGGFLSRERVTEIQGIPGLSRIPLLGLLFKTRREQTKETELAIFVTPRVVSENHAVLQLPVQRARAHLDHAFLEAPLMLAPMPTSASFPTDFPPDKTWDPYQGVGSQWGEATGWPDPYHYSFME